MKTRLFRRAAILCLSLSTIALATVAPAAGETFREAVVLERPGGPRLSADVALEANALDALVKAYIDTRISPDILKQRSSQVTIALEPFSDLAKNFKVVTRQDMDGNRVRIVSEADIDTGEVVQRLVTGNVLTFGNDPPRVLIQPGPNTSPALVQSLRARLSGTLGTAGITLLAFENTVPAESRADLIALVTMTSNRAPSPVAGVTILDTTVQFTLRRPRDNAIVAEQMFTARGSGPTQDLAQKITLDQIGPDMARGLAGSIGEAIFKDGNIIAPTGAMPGTIELAVFFRPDSNAISALTTLLKAKQWKVSLSAGGGVSRPSNWVGNLDFQRQGLMPADRMIVEGPDVSVEALYRVLTSERFGSGNVLRASVVEYADNYVGIEIVDTRPPRVPPVEKAPAPAPAKPRAPSPAPMQAGPPSPKPETRPGSRASVEVAVLPPLVFQKIGMKVSER